MDRHFHFFIDRLIHGIAFCVAICIILLSTEGLHAQSYPGYTLFTSAARTTSLIDKNNSVVHKWSHNKNGGYSTYLLPDGSLLRPALSSNSSLSSGGESGIVQRYSWESALLWEFQYSSNTFRTHHDIEPMPNGNVLLIAWEVMSTAECVASGLSRNVSLWPDHIIEVQPVGTNGGNIVWEWHAWDHLVQDNDPTKKNYGVVKDHPELLDINLRGGKPTGGDWMHINGISYNPELDQIVISSHTLNEIYVIDHSTTTAEAKGHTGGRWGKGGDFLYRWGMPSNYRAPGPQVFKVVHCAYWVPKGIPGAGHLMAFNNREGQGTSMVVEIDPPKDAAGNYLLTPGAAYPPSEPLWSFTQSGFYSNHLGSCQRLPNGNTLMAQSTSGKLLECDSTGKVVWTYQQQGQIIRALRYPLDYSGVKLQTSTSHTAELPAELTIESISPNPVLDFATVNLTVPKGQRVTVQLFDVLGRFVSTVFDSEIEAGKQSVVFNRATMTSGLYLLTSRSNGTQTSRLISLSD